MSVFMRVLLSVLSFFLFFGCCGLIPSQSETTYYQPPTQDRGAIVAQTYPNLDATISGCNTNFGISGETTTVYVTLSNTGTGKADNVVVEYSANDIETNSIKQSIGVIPAGKKITISSYVDTKFGVPTTAEVKILSKNSADIIRYSADCRQIDQQTLNNLNYLVQSGFLPV